MAKNTYPIALRQAATLTLLNQLGMLDKRLRTAVEQQLAEQRRIGLEAEAAQQALAAVYLATLQTADATLTLADLIKAVHDPWEGQPELEELDNHLRRQFLTQISEIAEHAEENIVQRFKR